eukprot:TRINITY_DN4243_c0_g2_i1.p1 TRINITY_DN4243_c0_g2~~TRINITY_DN4243_c0_g2_i1.p1  ORF type:complete len:592 (+),score=123.52 TRINITY_DN4243_c0_g2_i1:183-1778(+)
MNHACSRIRRCCLNFGNEGDSRNVDGMRRGDSLLLRDVSGNVIVAPASSGDLVALANSATPSATTTVASGLSGATARTSPPARVELSSQDDKEADMERAAAGLLCRAGEVLQPATPPMAVPMPPAVARAGTTTSGSRSSRMKDVSNFYLHRLGPEEAERLGQFRGQLPSLMARARAGSSRAAAKSCLLFWGVNLEVPGDATDIILLKHLRAEEGVVDVAAERLVRTLIYRAEENIDELAHVGLAEVGARFAAAGYIGGTDVRGRPVAVSRTPDGVDSEAMMSDIAGFVRYNFWMKEQAFKKLKLARGMPEDICQIIDLSTAKFGPPPKAVQESSKVFKQHCPESNGVNIFVNAPSWAVGVFKLCSKLFDQRTLDKIRLIGVDEHLQLFELVPPESVPVFLGGLRDEAGLDGELKFGQCQVVEVPAGEAREVSMLQVAGPADVFWQLRVCSQAIKFKVVFTSADAEQEPVEVARSADSRPLQAAQGVLCEHWRAPGAGTFTCRFECESARFGARARPRICLLRATAKAGGAR